MARISYGYKLKYENVTFIAGLSLSPLGDKDKQASLVAFFKECMKISRLIGLSHEDCFEILSKRSSQTQIGEALSCIYPKGSEVFKTTGYSDSSLINNPKLPYFYYLNLKNLRFYLEYVLKASHDQNLDNKKGFANVSMILYGLKNVNKQKILYLLDFCKDNNYFKVACKEKPQRGIHPLVSLINNSLIKNNKHYCKLLLDYYKSNKKDLSLSTKSSSIFFSKLLSSLDDKESCRYIVNEINNLKNNASDLEKRSLNASLYNALISNSSTWVYEKIIYRFYSTSIISRVGKEKLRKIPLTKKSYYRLFNLKGIERFCKELGILRSQDLYRSKFNEMPKSLKRKLSNQLDYQEKIFRLKRK